MADRQLQNSISNHTLNDVPDHNVFAIVLFVYGLLIESVFAVFAMSPHLCVIRLPVSST